MFKMNLKLIAFVAFFTLSQALIIPQELPSLLSLVYSNIPPVKKGTDSRIGVGFRLGEHADFQVLMELGPQKYTRPIGNEATSGNSKRQVHQEDFDKPIKTDANTWLTSWFKNVQPQQSPTIELNNRPQIEVKPFIPESSLKQLLQLYGKQGQQSDDMEQINEKKGTLPASSMDNIGIRDTVAIGHDRYKIFVKNPDQLIGQVLHKNKKKITEDLMDVSLELN